MFDEQATCTACGSAFYHSADERWKRLCLDCWRESKSKHDSANCLRCYQRGLAAGRATAPPPPGPTFDRSQLRELLQLVHPDKHNGSPLSQRVTQWLNDLRRRA